MKHLLFALSCFMWLEVQAQLELPCYNDSTGKIPLSDLGDTMVDGYPGGLYGIGGSAIPLSHYKRGRSILKNLKPLDSLGAINYVDGRIVFAGMGPSAASHAFNAWMDSLNNSYLAEKNPCLQVKSIFVGGKSLQDMADTISEVNLYWNGFYNQSLNKGVQYDEIQVAWLMQLSENNTMDVDTYISESVEDYIEAIQILKDSLPNLKVLFLTGMHYGGYSHPSHERYEYLKEPNSYWSNLVVQQVIMLQMLGDLRLQYFGPGTKAPYLAWGPHFWADGSNPRETDSLVWLCEDFRTDLKGGGFHLVEDAKAKEASLLRDFFREGELASILFLDSPIWAPCSTIAWDTLRHINPLLSDGVQMYPNPLSGNTLQITTGKEGQTTIVLYNLLGEPIFSENFSDSGHVQQIMLPDLNAGVYLLCMQQGKEIFTDKLIINP